MLHYYFIIYFSYILTKWLTLKSCPVSHVLIRWMEIFYIVTPTMKTVHVTKRERELSYSIDLLREMYVIIVDIIVLLLIDTI